MANKNNLKPRVPIGGGGGTTVWIEFSGPHGLTERDVQGSQIRVIVTGASPAYFNGIYDLSWYPGGNELSYTISQTSPPTPTGSNIRASVVVMPVTNTDSQGLAPFFDWAAKDKWGNIAVEGLARKSSVAPFYRSQKFTGEFNSLADFNVTTFMDSDS